MSHNINAEIEIEVRDREGKLIEEKKFKSKTWVSNFIKMLRTMMYPYATAGRFDSEITLMDVNGVSKTFKGGEASSTSNIYMAIGVRAPAGDDEGGILIGSSDTPYDKDDYSLASKIEHGTGTGQMTYGDTTVEDVSETASGAYFRIIRAFTNNSGDAITVKEVGLAVCNYYEGGSHNKFLICRDVLSSPISVPDGASLTVRYKITISYA